MGPVDQQASRPAYSGPRRARDPLGAKKTVPGASMIRSGLRLRSGSRASIVPRSHRPSKRCPLSNDSCPHARTWRRYVCKGRVSYAQERRRERRADKRKAEEKLEGCQDPRGVRNEGRRTDRGARGPLGVDSGWGVLWMLRRVRPLAPSEPLLLARCVPLSPTWLAWFPAKRS